MMDDVYQRIGGERRYNPDGSDGVYADPEDERERARRMGREYAMSGSEPLRRMRKGGY